MSVNARVTSLSHAEWLAGAAIGGLPILARLIFAWAAKVQPAKRWEDWCAEVLFLLIVISGSAVSVFVFGLIRNKNFAEHVGWRMGGLICWNCAAFFTGGVLYGLVAAEIAVDALLFWSISGLLGTFFASYALVRLVCEIEQYESEFT